MDAEQVVQAASSYAPEHRGPDDQGPEPPGLKALRGISQTAGPAVFFDGDRAAGANVFEALFDGGFRFLGDVVRIVEIRQVVEHIRQAILWQRVDKLVNVFADSHDGSSSDDTHFWGFYCKLGGGVIQTRLTAQLADQIRILTPALRPTCRQLPSPQILVARGYRIAGRLAELPSYRPRVSQISRTATARTG